MERRYQSVESKREVAVEEGSTDHIGKQHSSGNLTTRKHMEDHFDDDEFVEIEGMTTSRIINFEMDKKKRPGDGVVTEEGYICGRIALVSSEDFIVEEGCLGKRFTVL